MIAAPASRRLAHRSAFTLLEVLAVVTIIIVLASVAGIAVFKLVEDSYEDNATMNMQALERAYKTLCLKNPGAVDSSNFDLQLLVPYLEQGSNALIDPWGKPYLFRFGQSETGEFERIQFYTTNKKGEQIQWPRN